mgnify:CR=1 FL=1
MLFSKIKRPLTTKLRRDVRDGRILNESDFENCFVQNEIVPSEDEKHKRPHKVYTPRQAKISNCEEAKHSCGADGRCFSEYIFCCRKCCQKIFEQLPVHSFHLISDQQSMPMVIQLITLDLQFI